jgi:hypothetical protein
MKVAPLGHPSEPAPSKSGFARRLLRALRGDMGRLSGYATEFARAVLLALKRFTRSLLQVVRSSANGIFPPIGIVSVVVLTALTAGVPTWGTKRQFWPFYIFIISGLLFGRFLWKTPREKYGAIFVRTFGWLPVFLGALSYGYWYWYASLLGRSPDQISFTLQLRFSRFSFSRQS